MKYVRANSLTQGAVSAAWREIVQNSGLPYLKAEKINPLFPRLTFGPPLALGVDGECEFVDLYFERPAGEAEVLQKLSLTQKDGIKIIAAKRIPYIFPSVASLADAAEFWVSGYEKFKPAPLEKFLQKGSVSVTHENGIKEEISVLPFILRAAEEGGVLKITLRSFNARNLRVELFLAGWLNNNALFENGAFAGQGVKIIKKNLYFQNSLGGYEEV